MRVRCTALISPATYEVMEDSPWVHVGGEYIVLGIMSVPGGHTRIQIMTDDGEDPSPGWFDTAGFVTTDPTLPPNWTADIGEQGVFNMRPKRWLASGFWEDYFDDVPQAVAVFSGEYAIILASDANEVINDQRCADPDK